MQPAEKIIVSICCITYNHAPYIRQCLDGFLMQETDFAFEIIINDDASNDGTTEIIREYARQYPDLIHPIYHDENLYSQGTRGMLQKFVFPMAKGKYVALCEGDDYWTNPHKLRKQVDFMEEHPDCSLCFHPVSFIPLNEEDYEPYKNTVKLGYSSLGESEIPTCSMMFRRNVIDKIPAHPDFQIGDSLFIKTCSLYGRFFCLDDEMGAYRRHAGGWTNQDLLLTKQLLFNHFLVERQVFKEAFVRKCIDDQIMNFFTATRHLSQWGYFKTILMAAKMLPAHLWPGFFLKYFLPALARRIIPLYRSRKTPHNPEMPIDGNPT